MIFNSLVFLVFFALVLLVHHLAPLSWRARKAALLAFSLFFYASWNPPFVVLLVFSTVLDWTLAKAMAARPPGARRGLLVVSLASNLGLLAYFKYAAFAIGSVESLAHAAGYTVVLARPDVLLPVGISFYTFQTLSFTIDVYRGHTRPGDSFLDFALFVTFFPQLVAGPIVRPDQFLPQLEAPRPVAARQWGQGAALMTLGLAAKCVLADRLLGRIADKVFEAAADAAFFEAWVGTLAFAGQIFCDFSGYSMCAIGAALCLGFELPRNFHFPYAAVGFSDFWRRWHISLSTWLRDYLYVPLGGNRGGTARTLLNLQLTMLLGGLWHGASWTFVLWGGLHGALLCLERGLRAVAGRCGVVSPGPFAPAIAALTFAAVCFTWVFFRASSVDDARALCASMAGLGPREGARLLGLRDQLLTLTVMGSLVGGQWLLRRTTLEELLERTPWWGRTLVLSALLLVLILSSGDQRAFIYFQF